MELIVACSQNNIIGYKNKLLWNIPEDLKRFYKITKNNIVVMGRKTFESIGSPLKNRINIVITRRYDKIKVDTNLYFTNIENFDNLIEEINKDNKKIIIIGGASIYKLFLPKCNIVNITMIYKDYEGDTMFCIDKNNYMLIEESELYYSLDENCNYKYLIYKLL
jgi:dihydrofolate reductase